MHLRRQRRLLVDFFFGDNLRHIERNVRGHLQRLNPRLLQLSVEDELIILQLRDEIESGGLELRIFGAVKFSHLDVKPRADLRQGPVRVQLHVDEPGRERLRAEILEKLFQIEVLRLKCHEHFPIRWEKRLACSEIFPDERQRNVTGRVFRFPLVDLDLADLEGGIFRREDGLEIHLVAAEENRRNVETIGRIIRVDVRLERLQIRVAAFLQRKLELPRILELGQLAASFPIDHE